MKKILLSVATATLLTFNFSGCANNGLGVGVGSESVKKVFDNGTIENSQKVLVGKSEVATLTNVATGAAVGAGVGAIAGDSTKATIIGAGVGAIAGAVFNSFQEVEAYEIEIKSIKDGVIRKGYIESELPLNTLIEYIVREDGKITNIEVKKIGTPKEIIREKIVEKEVKKSEVLGKSASTVAPVKKTTPPKKIDKEQQGVSYKELVEAQAKEEIKEEPKQKSFW